jgi:Zn-finger nucleic acid-binding protein
MTCPRCGVLLNELTKAGVLIDVCDRCHGAWLDRGELEKITARLRELEREWSDPGVRSDAPARPEHRWRDDDWRHPKRRRWSDIFEIFD